MDMYEIMLEDIRQHRIRGSELISSSALLAFHEKKKILDKKCSFISTYLNSLDMLKKEILLAKTNDAMLQNVMDKIFKKERYFKTQTLNEIIKDVEEKINSAYYEISEIHHNIKRIGASKIKQGYEVFTHGHSNLVQEIIFQAKSNNVKFTLNISDNMLPLKEYVKDLTRKKINVCCFPFSGIYSAIKKADIILIGANSFNKKGFFQAEFGTNIVLSIAKKFNVPVYVCVDTLKKTTSSFDFKKIGVKNIWPEAPLKISFEAYEYDIISEKDITGIIYENGISSVGDFLVESFRV